MNKLLLCRLLVLRYAVIPQAHNTQPNIQSYMNQHTHSCTKNYTHTHTHTHTQTDVPTQACDPLTHTHTHTHTHTQTRTHAHTHRQTDIHNHTQTGKHARTNTHIQTHNHTHTATMSSMAEDRSQAWRAWPPDVRMSFAVCCVRRSTKRRSGKPSCQVGGAYLCAVACVSLVDLVLYKPSCQVGGAHLCAVVCPVRQALLPGRGAIVCSGVSSGGKSVI
jgi:hypothetical protein